jgi:DNA primase
MRFDPSFLDEIRARVPVSEVVRAKVKLKKEGREWRGLSPFNSEKTPSFYVNDQKGFFHDFSSGKHGDGIDFLIETEGISFPEAVERLAAMAGLPLPARTSADDAQQRKRASLVEVMELTAQFFERQLKEAVGREARAYLDKRGISPHAQAHFRLGYAPAGRYALRDALATKGVDVEAMIEAGLLKHGEGIAVPYDHFRNRVMFPICDRSGKMIAFGGRALQTDAPAKYINSPETPLFRKGATLYNLHHARKAAHEKGTIVVVEGYIDVIAMATAGFPNTVAPLGTALTVEQMELLWRMAEEPILCFDGDKAGFKAAYRAIDTALPQLGPGRTLRFVSLPDGQDPDELLRSSGPQAVVKAVSSPLPLIDVLWRRETEAALLDTPERRAALERRLKEVAEQIKDPSLRRHYARELQDRVYRLLASVTAQSPARRRKSYERSAFGRSPPTRPGDASGPVRIGAALASSPLYTGEKQKISPRECLILLILINHPQLVAENIEELAGLEFEAKDASALRNLLVESALGLGEATQREEGLGLRQVIGEAGLAGLLERLEGMNAHATLWNVRRGAATVDAEASLRQALALHRKVWALNRERLIVEGRLAADPTEADQARLAEIHRDLAATDGTEAALEGFGAMSGRVARVL